MYLKTQRFKNRPSIFINEYDLPTIIHYIDIGDRAIIQLPGGRANGQIKEISPTGLKVRIWDGEIGILKFFRWCDIIEIKKLTVKQKPQTKNRYVIIGLISILVIGMILLYTNL